LPPFDPLLLCHYLSLLQACVNNSRKPTTVANLAWGSELSEAGIGLGLRSSWPNLFWAKGVFLCLTFFISHSFILISGQMSPFWIAENSRKFRGSSLIYLWVSRTLFFMLFCWLCCIFDLWTFIIKIRIWYAIHVFFLP
jgi:hypothetical protein